MTSDSPAPRRRRLAPTRDLLRRAARRADIARKLRHRDALSLLMGIVLGIVGLMMPHALDRHAPRAARAAIAPGSARSDLAPAVRHDLRALERSEDGLFYATGEINGQPVRFLVGCGRPAPEAKQRWCPGTESNRRHRDFQFPNRGIPEHTGLHHVLEIAA